MGLKKRNKVSAEFSMSSLTDIIFLLLIFFMLTASLVQINIPLAESNAKTIAPTDYTVMITKDGVVTYNGKTSSYNKLTGQIRNDVNQSTNTTNATVTIVAEKGVAWQNVNRVMAIANNLRMRAIIATQPRKN
jgi:biopolymer transport protein ExbD